MARKYGVPFELESCKAKFFEIYMTKYAQPGSGIGYPGAKELVEQCRAAGLKTAVASSADLVKVSEGRNIDMHPSSACPPAWDPPWPERRHADPTHDAMLPIHQSLPPPKLPAASDKQPC